MATNKELLEALLAEIRAQREESEAAAGRAEAQRDKQDKKREKEEAKIKNQMSKADGHLSQLPVIGRITKAISTSISHTANKSLKLQEQALSRGSNLSKAMDSNSKVTNQLGGMFGKQVGSMAAIQTNFEMFSGGLGDASYETSRLVHATRLSSGQQKQLIAGLAKNTRGMGFTSDETSRLADTTLGMSQKYGVTTNELINAVGGLSDQLYDFAALGVGAEIQEAATTLAAGLGPAMANVGPELIGAFTKGESMVQAQLLGVMSERTELLKAGGNHTQAAIGLVTKGGAEAQRLIDQWTSGGMDRGLALQQLTQIYGKETTQLLAARNELQAQADQRGMTLKQYTKQMQKEAKIKQEWQNTWQNFKDKVVSPLQEVVMGFVNFGLQLISWFGPLIKIVAQLVLGVTSLAMAVIALKKAFLLKEATSKGIEAAKGLAEAGGGGIAGLLKGGFGKVKDFITGTKKGPAGEAGGPKTPKPGAGGGLPLPGAPAGGGGLGGFLGNLGEGLKKLGTTDAMKGAATIAILAASLAIAAFGFGLFADVDWESLGKGTVALGVLGGAAFLLGKFEKHISKGAGAIALLGLSLIPLAFAFNLIKDVGVGQILAFSGALIILAIAAAVAGTPAIFPLIALGAGAFALLGLSLIPLAAAIAIAGPSMLTLVDALIKFKDVPLMKLLGMAFVLPFLAGGLATMAAIGPALIFLGVGMALFVEPFIRFVGALTLFTEVPLGKILLFALMMPVLAKGILALGLIAPALFIVGAAMHLFIEPFMMLIMSLKWINDVPIGKMFLLGPALVAITMGLLFMTKGGLLMAAFDGLLALFGADSPIDKVVKMGKAAKHINKMGETLKKLPDLLRKTVRAMARITLQPFHRLGKGLEIVKKALDKFTILDMLKFKMFSVPPVKTRPTPMQPLQRRKNQDHQQMWSRFDFAPTKKIEGYTSDTTHEQLKNGYRKTTTKKYASPPSEGIADIVMPKPGEAPAIVDEARIQRKRDELKEAQLANAEMKGGSRRGDEMMQRMVDTLKLQLEVLIATHDSQNEGNEISIEGNEERREGNRQAKGRPSDRLGAGQGAAGTL